MVFEIGKYYKHSGGGFLHILGELDTTGWGKSLIAETAGKQSNGIIAAGFDEDNAQNYHEVTKEEWMTNFS